VRQLYKHVLGLPLVSLSALQFYNRIGRTRHVIRDINAPFFFVCRQFEIKSRRFEKSVVLRQHSRKVFTVLMVTFLLD
jgi:hypothetical protein